MPIPVSASQRATITSTSTTASIPIGSGNAASLPRFWGERVGQTHFVELGDTKTLSSASVNELALGYFRFDTHFNVPSGGTGVTLGSFGFASGDGRAPGIFPCLPALEGIPEIDFNVSRSECPAGPTGLSRMSIKGWITTAKSSARIR